MAESLLELKKKIASIQKTGQITEAMRMVSGVKLNRTEKLDQEYTIYNDKVRATVSHLMSSQIVNQLGKETNEYSEFSGQSNIDYSSFFDLGTLASLVQPRKEIKSTGYLVISGDRGLVGSYNSQVIKNMMSIFKDADAQNKDVKILAVGSVAAQFFKKQNLNVVYEYSGVSDVPTYNEVRDIVQTAVKMYLNGVYDELFVCYTHHVNTLTSAFRVESMLPISDIDINHKETMPKDYIIEPDIDSVLKTVLPQFAKSMIFGAILDAKTAEHASSMTAMQSASQNADDVVSGLKTKLNRARQAQITTEITEIIGGANALE
ncbi:F0F1 ATP synthase subunit gamma [Lactobacillus johnsonii]|uniref:ATP synthase gamma chain n=4 Tax=Lactobacillus TaxID=1578 RepID=ATPG_LACJO|nr:F0F1 ATP synthase subunit gamma [Lactobacillus johnsonii]Q74K16.1 RecName: Full=ATP synthase gamma chain; AltName: Full=ATP synthase F1 sector gamma subunit; AltName: Full=F-ATPase gamma subunit [Lactobacillus johnsonii NCC 533]AAS08760.1 ATP synthase gamma chain [Lactobacillus johnsonii NCC 533]AHA97581.1 ATP synthase subunit gamma [Lactobacillus johnsonii N6.2]AYN48603.1 ATP synthase gamma chain [Lactobacillus johnsonii]AZZ67831.1 F0F1 ATP synthase subunit gamma [Lactobacillus johnsonii]